MSEVSQGSNQVKAINSVVNIGGNMQNISIKQGSEAKIEKKSKEELMSEIAQNYMEYIKQINQLPDIDPQLKQEAAHAVLSVGMELGNEQPDEQKIKSIWEPLQNISYIAAICSAICDLMDLIK